MRSKGTYLLIDLQQAGESGIAFHSRFCIIGGGISGLILARQLASFGLDVTLLEAGGLELEERSQVLFEAEMASEIHTGALSGRFRAFGGSSTRWGGQLLPFSNDIFTPVEGSPSIAWPISAADVSSYYSGIQDIFDVGSLPFTDEFLTEIGKPTPSLSSGLRLRYSKWAPFGKRNLANTIGKDCLANPLIKVYTHANAASLEGNGGRIKSARVVDYRLRSFTFTADFFVVCCGTIESSRLLLSSPGVPNSNDQLGRYFHDHISFHAAVLPSDAKRQLLKTFGPFFVNGVLHTAKIEADSELQRDAGLVACMAHFVIQEPEDSGVAAVRNLLTAVQRGNLRTAVTSNLPLLIHGAGDVLNLLWSSKILRRRAVSKRATVRINIDMEQLPNPDNRIRLSPNLDSLGLAKAIVDWRIGDGEYSTAQKYAFFLKEEFEARGFPSIDWTAGLIEGVRPSMADTYHPMGGLRMGLDQHSSVVDPDLKVHGLSNLYVASCAVFPSGGSSNPTFTLMALTLRLANLLHALSSQD